MPPRAANWLGSEDLCSTDRLHGTHTVGENRRMSDPGSCLHLPLELVSLLRSNKDDNLACIHFWVWYSHFLRNKHLKTVTVINHNGNHRHPWPTSCSILSANLQLLAMDLSPHKAWNLYDTCPKVWNIALKSLHYWYKLGFKVEYDSSGQSQNLNLD